MEPLHRSSPYTTSSVASGIDEEHPVFKYQETLQWLDKENAIRLKNAHRSDHEAASPQPSGVENKSRFNKPSMEHTTFTMSLNQDQLIMGPINPEAGVYIQVQLYDGKQMVQDITTRYSSGMFSSLPTYISAKMLIRIVQQFPEVGRITLTAIPRTVLGLDMDKDTSSHLYLCVNILKGQEGIESPLLARNTQIDLIRVGKGITYFQARFLAKEGSPLHEDIKWYLVAHLKYPYQIVDRVVKELETGFNLPGVDRYCAAMELEFDWQGGFAIEKASRTIRAGLSDSSQNGPLQAQFAFARANYRQPKNGVTALKFQNRSFSTAGRSILRTGAAGLNASNISSAVSRLTIKTYPFASTLRPNLTGGTLCRTAGGYAIGAGRVGGARYFSSSPVCPAQVIQNVSVGIRAFCLSGKRTRFDGVNKHTGAKQYNVVTPLQEETSRKMQSIPRNASGSSIDFRVSPTITAFGYFGSTEDRASTLTTADLMDVLSGDFARALKELAAVLNDLKRLATLGDLPISLENQSTIRVRFPGCDAETVERLCIEVGVQRGVIRQDEDFDAVNGAEMALLFPFAPSCQGSNTESPAAYRNSLGRSGPELVDWQLMLSPTKSPHSLVSTSGGVNEYSFVQHPERNPWAGSGSSSLDSLSELGDRAFFPDLNYYSTPSASDYQGIEGIHRFLEECDRAKS
ncbi:hypothetical protein FQN57_005183 [Myotisia sp. PD_48]|nr:hypothetical protein FQN57_005183 [Myotisia sp. PD_48]